MGTLFNKDLTLFRGYFKEQAKLLGIHVKYKYPIDPELNLHGRDAQLGFSEPIEMDIILSQSPKLSTLKRLGWVSEDPNEKPWLAQLPYDAPNLQKNCRILFDAPLPLGMFEDDKGVGEFKVTEITVDQIFPDSYYCKLAPVFETPYTLKPENYKDKSYSYLKVDQDAT